MLDALAWAAPASLDALASAAPSELNLLALGTPTALNALASAAPDGQNALTSPTSLLGSVVVGSFYYHHFTADLKTANKSLCLSEGNTVITDIYRVQPYPDHPDRFDVYPQVLCSKSVSGRCYWEVEWSGAVFISVSYKSISRKGKGDECVFGFNDQSWSLCCCDSSCLFRHKNIKTKLPVVSRSSRIGVYVDHSSGSLSFYSVSDTMTLIHRVNTTFTKPLYPGFYVHGSVKLCDMTI
ncbi:cytolytic toxin-beta-like [Misgurnus anguillicaudatus]|uniref:cytolytic toxin-beta-like n=1 Tax=Misgurnus anguillicaudatus TaxID=75329 RepID=UPI003CCF5431